MYLRVFVSSSSFVFKKITLISQGASNHVATYLEIICLREQLLCLIISEFFFIKKRPKIFSPYCQSCSPGHGILPSSPHTPVSKFQVVVVVARLPFFGGKSAGVSSAKQRRFPSMTARHRRRPWAEGGPGCGGASHAKEARPSSGSNDLCTSISCSLQQQYNRRTVKLSGPQRKGVQF